MLRTLYQLYNRLPLITRFALLFHVVLPMVLVWRYLESGSTGFSYFDFEFFWAISFTGWLAHARSYIKLQVERAGFDPLVKCIESRISINGEAAIVVCYADPENPSIKNLRFGYLNTIDEAEAKVVPEGSVSKKEFLRSVYTD